MAKYVLPKLSLKEMHQRAAGFFLMDSAAFFIYLQQKGIDPINFLNWELENWPLRKYDSPVRFLLHVMTAYYAMGTPRENFQILKATDQEAKGRIMDCIVKKMLDAKPKVRGKKRDLASSAQMLGESKVNFRSDPFCKHLCIYYMNGEAKRTGLECLVKKGYGPKACQMHVKRVGGKS